MWWIPIAAAAVSMMNAKKQADNQEAYNKAQAEMTKYSPWTGVAGKITPITAPSALGAAASGAIQGMAIQQGIGKGFGLGSDPSGASMSGASSPYSLGGDQMISDIEKQKFNTGGSSPYQFMQPSMFASNQNQYSLR